MMLQAKNEKGVRLVALSPTYQLLHFLLSCSLLIVLLTF